MKNNETEKRTGNGQLDEASGYADFGKAVIEWIVETEAWEHEFSDELLEIAAKHDLAQRCPYDPEIHGEGIDTDIGDDIWFIHRGDKRFKTEA